MSFYGVVAAVVVLGACARQPARAEGIVGWRGDGSGVFAAAKVATTWNGDKKQNVLWTAPVGSSYSCPVLVKAKGGDRVLVTSEPDKLQCVDAATGKVLWEKSNGFDQLPADLKDKDQQLKSQIGNTAPTPVSDGEHVWAVFGNGIVACYDLEGKREWITFVEREGSEYGRSASPTLAGGILVVPMQYMNGLDAKTGKVVWTNKDAEATYGSIIAAKVGKLDVVATPKGDLLRATDGKALATKLGESFYSTPVVSGDVFYWIGNDAVAVQVTAKGDDAVATKELWNISMPESGDVFSSPVVAEGKVYSVNVRGCLTVLNAKSGKVLQGVTLKIDPAGQQGAEDSAAVYASLSLVDGKLFASNNRGDMAVLRTTPDVAPLQENSLAGQMTASAVWADGRMFVRSGDGLFCIGVK